MPVATPRTNPAGRRSPARTGRAPKASAAAPAQKRRPRARPPARPVRAVVPVGAGTLWGLVLAASLLVSSFLSAVVLIPVAVVATASAVRAAGPRRPARRPSPVLIVAVAAAVVDPLAALGGPVAALVVVVATVGLVGALALSSVYAISARPLRTLVIELFAALAPAVAVTAVIVARHQGTTLALLLVGATLAYDCAAFLMGHGRTALGGPVGVVFGMVSLAVLAVFAAAVMNPPFSGTRPWVMFAGVAVLAPLGVRLAEAVAGRERLPALRRLDSWTLVAPFWVLAAALVLHR